MAFEPSERPRNGRFGVATGRCLCHSGRVAEDDDGVDFALAAFRQGGVWTVQELAHDQLADVETISHALRRLPGDGGAVAMVAVALDIAAARLPSRSDSSSASSMACAPLRRRVAGTRRDQPWFAALVDDLAANPIHIDP